MRHLYIFSDQLLYLIILYSSKYKPQPIERLSISYCSVTVIHDCSSTNNRGSYIYPLYILCKNISFVRTSSISQAAITITNHFTILLCSTCELHVSVFVKSDWTCLSKRVDFDDVLTPVILSTKFGLFSTQS